MSHEVFHSEPAGTFCPEFHNGPTPFAVARAQIIHASMPTPHHVHTMRNGILNFSGRSHRNGVERNQKTTKPTNCSVVVGKFGLNVFGMRAYDGQIAVKHTATRRPPFQPTSSHINHKVQREKKSRKLPFLALQTGKTRRKRGGKGKLTLHSIPNKIQHNPLQKRYKASPQPPTIPILHREPNMPLESDPRNQRRETRNENATDDYDEHGLGDGKTHGYLFPHNLH